MAFLGTFITFVSNEEIIRNLKPHTFYYHGSMEISSSISELQIFIYDDSYLYLGQSALACCRAPVTIRG